jgi:hypothetical protein
VPHDHVFVTVEGGRAEQEELAVATLADGRYRSEVPPAMTVGLAVGDVFEIDPATFRPIVVERSGNLTVWLYLAESTEAVRDLAAASQELGGTAEGAALANRVFIFTIPIAATFPVIERLFNRFVDQHPGSEWMFANVFAEDGVTPLGWWT